MRTLSWIGLGLGLALTTMGCSPSQVKTSSMKRATANDGTATSLLRVPRLSGGSDLLLKTNNYQTPTPTPMAYRIACNVPSERDALLTALGFNPRDADSLPLAYTDPANPPEDIALLDWDSHPDIRCRSNRPAAADETADQVVLRRSQLNDKTLFYLQVRSSPVSSKAKNLYELGCQGLMEGMGYSLQDAEIIDPQSYIQGSQGRIFDMNCPNGQVADLIPFVAECERARRTGSSNPRDEAYNELFEHMQEQGFQGSNCTDLWNHLKPKTSLDISGLQISSLEPIRYLTKLQTLAARDNFLTDLSPLSNVSSLQNLDLGINPDLSDFQPLASLKSLRQLKLDNTAARDIAPLSALRKLAILDLSHTFVRLPNLDALKSLRITDLILTGLTLSWREKEQSFFTNCFHLAHLPVGERSSMRKILEAFGATVGSDFKVTPGCFAIYRDVTNANVWPELDLSPHMRFPVGDANPSQTACLRTEILPILNELPASIRLDYEGCSLEAKDMAALHEIERLSYLDLRDTGLTDLTALASHPNIANIVLDLNGTLVDALKCPVDTKNPTLNSYCLSRRTIAATATKAQHYVGARIQNLLLATFSSVQPEGVSWSLLENTCGSWLTVNAMGQASGTVPLAFQSCSVTLIASREAMKSNEVRVDIISGVPGITGDTYYSVDMIVADLEVAKIVGSHAVPGSIIATGGSCRSWLTVHPNGRVSGRWLDPGYSCTLDLKAQSEYGESSVVTRVLYLKPRQDLSALTQSFCGVGPSGLVRCWGTGTRPSDDPDYQPHIPTWEYPVANDPVVQVTSVQNDMTCSLVQEGEGEVLCSGSLYKVLPNGAITTEYTPVPWTISGFEGIVQIAGGSQYLCGLRADGRVLCWGKNDVGQAGFNPATRPIVGRPEVIPGLTNVQYLSAGSNHTCAARDDGSAFCWGSNDNGQLGNGNQIPSYDPQHVQLTDAVLAIEAGDSHSCAILRNRKVACWGSHPYGLGDGSRLATVPIMVPGLTQVRALSLSETNTCAVTLDGKAFCWGANDYGQVGSGTASLTPLAQPTQVRLDNVTDIAVSYDTVCALTHKENIYCWGILTRDDDMGAAADTSALPFAVGRLF